MLKKGTTSIDSVFKGATEIAEIRKGTDLVYENAQTLTLEGVPPLFTIQNCKNANLKGYKIYGESVQRLVPKDYTQLDYIDTNNTQCYIDTDISAKVGTKFEICFQYNSVSSAEQFMGRSWYDNGGCSIGYATNASASQLTAQAGHTLINNGILDTNKHTASLSIDSATSATFTVDGVDVTSTISFTANTGNLILFGRNINSSLPDKFVDGKLYYAKIYEGSNLVGYFIPCKNPSSVIGLYDIVGKKFYQNASTGTFVAGTEQIIPTSEVPIEIKSVGDKTVNILDIYGRTQRTSTSTAPINTSEYYIGKAYSDYYNASKMLRAALVGDTWHIQSQSGQNPYGVGFPVEVQPSTKYYVEGTKTKGAYAVSYYDGSGTHISGVNNVSSNFTTPATCAYCFLILRPDSDDEATFKNVMLSTTNIVGTTEYIGYGYSIPLRITGKNLVDVSNVVRSNNFTYDVSNNDLVLTPTGSSTSGNYYINMGEYSNFVGKTLTFNTSMITNSSTAKVQFWLIATKANKAWTTYDTIKNKDILANTTDGYTVTIPEGNYYQLVLRFYAYNNNNSDTITMRNVQAEVSSSATAWTPYLTPKVANIFLPSPLRRLDYNLFNVDKVKTLQNNNDGTYTVLSVSNSKANASQIYLETGKTYTWYINIVRLNGSGGISFRLYNSSGSSVVNTSRTTTGVITFTVSADGYYYALNGPQAVASAGSIVKDLIIIEGNYTAQTLPQITYTDYLDFETKKVYRNVEVIDTTNTKTIQKSFQGLATPIEQSVSLNSVKLNHAVNMVDVPTSIIPNKLWIKYKGKE